MTLCHCGDDGDGDDGDDHPAVAPGQSQRDTLSMLDHCWKVFRIPFFW